MNLTTLTDAEFEAHRIAVSDERERRFNLSLIPAQVAHLAAEFISSGGKQAALDAAVAPAS